MPQRPLTVERAALAVDDGEIDTVVVAITDMQGRLQGKRFHARYFLDEVLEHGTEGCNYLLAVDVDMNTVDGYAMSSWAQRLRRLRDDARPVARCAASRGSPAPRWCWPTSLARRHARSSPRRGRSCRRSSPGSPSAGLHRLRRHRAGVHRLPRHLRGGLDRGLPRPHPGQPVQRRLLAARHRPGRAAAAPHPQRHGRRRAAGRVGQGRVQPRPARDRVPLRRGAAHLRRPRHLQERRQGDRRAGGHVADLHGQVRRARGQLLPHPLQPARHDGAIVFADGATGGRPGVRARSIAGLLATMREFTLLYAPNINSYKRYQAGLVRPDRGALGPRQPHLRAAGGRARRRRCGWRTGCPAATSTPTWRSPR